MVRENVVPLPAQRRILVIRNPTSGGGSALFSETINSLNEQCDSLALRTTTARGDGQTLAAGASRRDFDLVVAAGGDGTVAEVVSGLMAQAAESDPEQTPPAMAILPTGTANVLANEVGLPFTAEELADLIAAGQPVSCSVGQIESYGYFGAMAGAGFDAHVVDQVDLGLKKRLGKAAYVWSALKALRETPNRYQVSIDGRTLSVGAVIVTLSRFYAGRFLIAPGAHLTRSEFKICLLAADGLWDRLKFAVALPLGLVPKLGSVRVLSGREVLIKGTPGEPLQADGDIAAQLPVRLIARPGAIKLIVPTKYRAGARA
ncbi:MAG: diacylglycerol kinase family protein [Pseudomonadota bacterium]